MHMIYEEFPEPGTEAWGIMNKRRWELIQKKHNSGLNAEEQIEFDYLQKESLLAVEKKFGKRY